MPHSAVENCASSEPLRVLVAEDDPDSRDVFESAIRRLGYACDSACDGLEAWEMHVANKADIVISDWEMPRMSGIELCERVRGEDPPGCYTPFIFVTGNADKSHFVAGMHAGADDYLSKPVDIDALEARLEVSRRGVLLQRELRAKNARLKRTSDRAFHDARTDPLTAASNRLALTEDLEALAARAARYHHRYCAALCDVDDFKSYNDYFGHVAGDDALRLVARTMHAELRKGDGLYRYGGDEFLVIMPEQGLPEAAIGMERVRRAVDALQVSHAPGARARTLTLSVGIAALGAGPADSLQGWLKRSDQALYVAKAKGRNRVEIEAGEVILHTV